MEITASAFKTTHPFQDCGRV